MKPKAYVYDAAMHCPDCAHARFGDALDDPETVDSEGNPITAAFSWQLADEDYCDECLHEAIANNYSGHYALLDR